MGHNFEAIMIHDLCLYQQSCLFGSIKNLNSRIQKEYILYKNKLAHNYKNNGLSLTKISPLFRSSNIFKLRESRN
jgi:hypothetical protein